VSGRVVRSDTGQQIPRVRITVVSGGQPPHTLLTDTDGRYAVRDLPAGQYRVTASKSGFVTLTHGQRRPADAVRLLDLGERVVLEDIDFALPPTGAVEGHVYDDLGEPIAAATVQVLRRRFVNGERRLTPEGVSALTDDLGRFRVYGVPAGEYYLSATVPRADLASVPGVAIPQRLLAGQGPGTAPTYYPGAASPAEAQLLSLDDGQVLAGLLIQVFPFRTAAIAGVVRSSGGGPAVGGSVSLGQTNAAGGSSSRGGVVRADGSFSFPDLPPGEYTIVAQYQGAEAAVARVALNGEDAVLSLTTSGVGRARGRVSFDTGTPPDVPPERVQIRIAPIDGLPRVGQGGPGLPEPLGPDWTFDLAGLLGTGEVSVFGAGDWRLKSVLRNGVDVTHEGIDFQGTDVDGLDVVLTQTVTMLSGTIGVAAGAPAPDAVVVVFADDPERWGARSRFVRAVRPDRDGRFMIGGLPPFRYVAIAIDSLEPGEERDPELLERLRPRGTRVTLGEGESRTVDLRMTER
jgi:hypothetical protein